METSAVTVGEESVPISNGLGSLVERLTTHRRLLLALSIIVFVTFAAQIREVANHEETFYRGGDVPVGSDFNAFYSAGRVLIAGDGSLLYDLERQQVEQLRTLGTDDFDGFQPFAYPAFAAAPYALLGRFPFLWAYAIHTAVMLAATGAVVLLLRSMSPTVRDHSVLMALAIFASQPLIATIFGGQTVAFSLLCLTGCYAALRQEQCTRAGFWLGLLLYKPQLALPLLALLLLRRQWRAAGIASLVGFSLVIAGIVVAGPDWPWNFINLAGGDFYAIEARENGFNMISLLGVAEQVFEPKSVFAYGFAGLLVIPVLAFLLVAWRGSRPAGSQFPLQFGLAIAVTLMVSPHALFYEAALLILPIIFLIDSWRDETTTRSISPNQRLALIGLFTSGYLWSLGSLVGFQVLAAVPVIIAVLTWQELGLRLPLGQASVPWRFPLGVSWGESPSAPSGKRS